MRPALVALVAFLALGSPAFAQGASDSPDVHDTSFVAGNGERTLRQSIDVPAPASEVWQAFATAEGWKSWAVGTAYVDFREGGQIETNYKPDQPQGGRDNIRNQIIAIVPGQALIFRNVQAPANFENPDLFARVITIIQLEAIDAGTTRVTISGDGYGASEGFDKLYAFFAWGNGYTLAELRKHFTDAKAETTAPVMP